MDIDSPASADAVFVHPLALVHMSDQYTRIRWGGSPLDASAPVVGLLFGKQQLQQGETTTTTGDDTTGNTTATTTKFYVEDAGDIPLDDAEKQIELHRAVYPNHQVMGWYKVVVAGSDEDEPTVHDLKQTQQIQSLYQSSSSSNNSKHDTQMEVSNTASDADTNPIITTFFGLLHVPSTMNKKKKPAATNRADPDGDATMKTDGKSDGTESKTDDDDDDDDDDDELPLTLYRLEGSSSGQGNGSLIAVRTWSLHTSESERIAVQRVMREKTSGSSQPPEQASHLGGGGGGGAGTATQRQQWLQQQQQQQQHYLDSFSLAAVEPQVITPYADELQESCLAISARLSLILQYLETLQQQQQQQQQQPLDASANHLPLLRHVQALLLQLGVIAGTAPSPKDGDNNNSSSSSNSKQLQQLASLAKAVDAVTLFTEKFRFLNEHAGSGGGGGGLPRGGPSREGRRF
ncbi:hypothetical protein ACA910_007954 [Epithemia clementina (nom. ined.)]